MPEQRGPDMEVGLGDELEPQSAAAVLDDIDTLRERASTAEGQRDEYLALLRRTRADFENYQKRVARDLAEEQRFAHSPFARELLPVLDNLSRAVETARAARENDPVVDGISLVQSQLLDIFNRFGVTLIDALGRPFDPAIHEAVAQEPRSDVTPGTVVEVHEPGYCLHERVVRPARVVVSKSPNW